jgi:hypothetical protein
LAAVAKVQRGGRDVVDAAGKSINREMLTGARDIAKGAEWGAKKSGSFDPSKNVLKKVRRRLAARAVDF